MTRRRKLYGLLAFMARALQFLFGRWMIFAALALYFSPISPHLRWEYQYRGTWERPVYVRCTYLGPRGFVTTHHTDCPFITFLDMREGQH